VNLYEFATTTDASGEQLVSCRIAIANQADPASRTEWIDAQIAIDQPTSQNGAVLRAIALRKVRDELDLLAKHFEQIARPSQLGQPNQAGS